MRGAKQALVVVDMPYGSYATPQAALANAQALINETGADAVKLEGGEDMAEVIRLLVSKGIAVMGHVGLLPQSVSEAKGFRYQGKTDEEAAKIVRDARAVEAAGAHRVQWRWGRGRGASRCQRMGRGSIPRTDRRTM